MSSPYMSSKLHDLNGLVAVVTGGGSGLGQIIARALESNGARVYITGRREAKLDETVKLAEHGNIVPIIGDVRKKEDLQRAVDYISKDAGHIDLLVNNAGITNSNSDPSMKKRPDTKTASVSELRDYYFNYRSEDDWKGVLETNIVAVFLTSMAFLELLDAGNKRRSKDLPSSQIITIGSAGGLTRFTDSFIYNASKAGVHHLTKTLGAHLLRHKIRTNIVCPGWFPSEMSAPMAKIFENPVPIEMVPEQRMGNADEMAGTILYLASKAGGYCNGASMVIDGGVLTNHSGP